MEHNEPFATFFIDFEPILNQKKLDYIKKTTIDNLKKQQIIANKEIEKDAKNRIEKINKLSQEFTKRFTKQLLSGLKITTNISKEIGAISLVIGTLSLLKFDSIAELNDNMERIGENSKLAYKYLSASNKVIGASQSGVINELDSIAKAIELKKALNINSRPEWVAFGANTSMSMDDILTKFREKIQSLTKEQGKVFAERMGLSNTYRIAELSEEEFDKLVNLSVYNEKSINKLKESAKATKAVLGELKDVKDTMLIQFSPLVVSSLKSIGDFLNSKEVLMVISSFSGLASDIGKFNDTLKGIPFKTLISALAVNGVLNLASTKHGSALIGLGVSSVIFQDLYHGFKESILNKRPGKDNVKQNISHHLFDNLKFVGNMLNNENNENNYPFGKNSNNNVNNNTNNETINNTFNINVNSRDQNVAKDIKREIQSIIDNNKNREYHTSEFK